MTWPMPTHDSLKAKLSRTFHPNYGWCMRCGFVWANVEAHHTKYNAASSCFPLCESCWTLLGCPEARIEYYAALIQMWEINHPVEEDTKREIQRAVANGG